MERESEGEVQDRPQVLQGEDEPPRQPAPPRDPYVAEPGPTPGERRAFRLLPWAWLVVLVLAGIILYAVFR
jgi:hypothetical protein